MAEKSSFIRGKIEFQEKNRVLSFLVKSSFPQNAQKSLQRVLYLFKKCQQWTLTNSSLRICLMEFQMRCVPFVRKGHNVLLSCIIKPLSQLISIFLEISLCCHEGDFEMVLYHYLACVKRNNMPPPLSGRERLCSITYQLLYQVLPLTQVVLPFSLFAFQIIQLVSHRQMNRL